MSDRDDEVRELRQAVERIASRLEEIERTLGLLQREVRDLYEEEDFGVPA